MDFYLYSTLVTYTSPINHLKEGFGTSWLWNGPKLYFDSGSYKVVQIVFFTLIQIWILKFTCSNNLLINLMFCAHMNKSELLLSNHKLISLLISCNYSSLVASKNRKTMYQTKADFALL